MRVVAVVLCLWAVTTGCGTSPSQPDEIRGDDVAAMAERELEQENARMAAGTMSCPDLPFEEGSSVRCLRTTELSGGRVVKVDGTVTVTSRAAGGRLHVAMDPTPREIGLSPDQLADGVRRWYVERTGQDAQQVECPYLRGLVGTTVACRAVVGGDRGRAEVAEVEVVAVDLARYTTTYVVRPVRH
jgi:hypothetical protein